MHQKFRPVLTPYLTLPVTDNSTLTAMVIDTRIIFQRHWFFIVAALIVAGDLSAVAYAGWEHEPRALEASLLFDFAVLIPALAAWRSRANPGKAVLQAICLASLAVWGLGHIVPVQHQVILAELAWLRPLVIVLAVVAEIGIIVAFYRAVFVGSEDVAAVSKRLTDTAGLPAWAQKLVAIEVRMWRSVRDVIRRILGRG
jgi:hypothetical protein